MSLNMSKELIVNVDNYSEFPSLSSAPQPQNQNSAAHAIWANPTIRNGQSNSVRRTQNSIPSSQNSINNHIHHIQSNLQESALGTTHGGNSNEEYRFGNQQGNPGQLSGLAQTQPGNAEDFPPLERSTSEEVDHERRSRASEQSAAPGGGGARNDNVGAMSKNGTLGEQENGHSDNINSSGVIGGQGMVDETSSIEVNTNISSDIARQSQGSRGI